MNVLSLFSGIGGIDLGFERAGHRIVGQVEIDPFCRAVLEKHWPGLWRHDDITTLNPAAVPGPVDCIAGGFPCQRNSSAARGRNNGPDLWPEMGRLVRSIRPRVVFVENVDAIRRGHIGTVLGDLAASGYDGWWDSIPAASVGAPHYRSRVWIVACHANSDSKSGRTINAEASRLPRVAWPDFPDDVGMGYGVPYRMDRLRALGNAVVPQVVEAVVRAMEVL